MAYPHDPHPGGHHVHYGPPVPQRPGKGPLFWLIVIGLPILLLSSCAVVIALAPSARPPETVTAPPVAFDKRQEQPTVTPTASEPTEPTHTVEFEATGGNGAGRAGNITYSRDFDVKQEAGVPLPYSKSVTVQGDALPRLSLWVQNAESTGSITCRIKVDGRTIREDATDTPYGVCNIQSDAGEVSTQPAEKPAPTEKPEPAEKPASTKRPEPTKSAASNDAVLPNVVGMNLQEAQDTMQAAGFYLLDDQDDSGQHRLQVFDRNWVVTRQDPEPGKKMPTSTKVVLWAKKYSD